MPVISEQLKPIDTVNGFRSVGFSVNLVQSLSQVVSTLRFIHTELPPASFCCFTKAEEPYAVIPFPESYRIGFCYSMIVFDLDIEEFEYAYRLDGLMMKRKDSVLIKTKSCWILMRAPSPDRASGGM